WLMVRLPCGSRSTSSTFRPCSANATPRFSVVVVFATPPFWLANEITRPIGGPLEVSGRIPGRGSRRASPIEPLSSLSCYLLPPRLLANFGGLGFGCAFALRGYEFGRTGPGHRPPRYASRRTSAVVAA